MSQDSNMINKLSNGRVLIRKRKIKRSIPNNKSPQIHLEANIQHPVCAETIVKSSCIKIAHVNINGIRNKLDSVSAELSNYDVICISETKLNSTIQTQDLEINGFKIPIRKDRQINSGGGLIIFIKNNLSYMRRNDLESDNVENIWIEVNSLKNNFLVGLFYRPPNSGVDYWDLFEENIELASEKNSDIVILGDLNQDMIQLDNNSHICKIMSKFNLQCMISEPTRITNTTATCLDLIITNHSSIINNTEILPPFHSDHCTVTAEIAFKTYHTQAQKKTIWKYEEADIESIETKLENTDWSFM